MRKSEQTALFPIRLDDAVMDHDAYKQSRARGARSDGQAEGSVIAVMGSRCCGPTTRRSHRS